MSSDFPSVVAVSNHLLRAGYELTAWEHRIVNAAAAQIGSDTEAWTSERPFILEASTLRDLFDEPPENIYRSMDRAVRKLMRRVITYRFTPEGRKREVEVQEHWVRRAIYDKKHGRVILYWEDTVLPYLTDLSREFTQYQLADIAQLSGKWAPRLYQLLMTYRSVGRMEIPVEDLKFALQVGKSAGSVAILKRDVLNPAVKEICDKLPDLNLQMSERRLGRRITHLQFSFTPSTVRQERENKQIDWVDQDAEVVPKQTAKPTTKKSQKKADNRPEWQKDKDEKRERKNRLRAKLRDIGDLDW